MQDILPECCGLMSGQFALLPLLEQKNTAHTIGLGSNGKAITD